MKTSLFFYCLIVYFMFLSTALFSQEKQELSKEETEIVAAIENAVITWRQRDYENWEKTWVQDENIMVRWQGPNNFNEINGWEELSKINKELFEKGNGEENPTLNHTDYSFRIEGKMAFVTYQDKGNQVSSLLTKEDGNWKYVNEEIVAVKAYEVQKKMKELASLEGNWRADPSSIQMENTENQLLDLVCSIKPTEFGTRMNLDLKMKMKDGNVQRIKEELTYNFDENSIISCSRMVKFLQYGNTMTFNGNAEILEDGTLSMITPRVGNEAYKLKFDIKRLPNNQIEVKEIVGMGMDTEWLINFTLMEADMVDRMNTGL